MTETTRPAAAPDPRAVAEAIRRAALAAVDPADAVLRAARLRGESLIIGDETFRLDRLSRIWILAAGKAARGMAAAALDLLGRTVFGGSVVVPDGLGGPLDGLDLWEAAHPIPDVRGLAAAAEALGIARRAAADDLVLCLLSGGASALWTAPVPGVTLDELRGVTEALLRAGAPIESVNLVRRHLSRIGGGGLARAAAPARVTTLAISDVLGGDPHSIGSGPAVVDPTTHAEALDVLARYEMHPPTGVLRHLQSGAAGDRPETLKSGDLPEDPTFHVAASIRDALAAAAEEAVRLGYSPRVVSDQMEGAASTAGDGIARAAIQARATGGRQVLLWGGETTVAVRGSGRGGRNQEVALAAALRLEGHEGITITTFATDGVDGPTSAAGAVVDGSTIGRGRGAGLDPAGALRENDSYTFLEAAGALIVTGPTGTNVNDLAIAVIP